MMDSLATSEHKPLGRAFRFHPAVRANSKVLIGLYGLSGTGKTYSALLLARGLVGPTGRVCMIDTESGRGELYADVIPGGYEVEQLRPPFTAQRYIAALEAAEAAKAGCLIIDSVSHEWEGAGGVLDQASAIEARTGKPGLHCWKTPKMNHQWFLLRLLQTEMHVILCLRAKFKSRQVKTNGKTEIVKDDHASPIQAEDFIFDMTAHAEILQDHTLRLTKCGAPDIEGCFPRGAPVTIKTGEALAVWCNAGAARKLNTHDAALAEARRGVEAFRAWWKAATRAQRGEIDVDFMKEAAANADRLALEVAGVNADDPFAGDAPEMEAAPEPVSVAFLDDAPSGQAGIALNAKAESVAGGGTASFDGWLNNLTPDDLAMVSPNLTHYRTLAAEADASQP